MARFVELTPSTDAPKIGGKKIAYNINTIVSIIDCGKETRIDTVDGDYYYLAETYEEIKELIFEAENKQNSIANAILEIDQTLYHRLR